jgi:dipeptidyl aminopeptidase/acylaminoacyl peptidase
MSAIRSWTSWKYPLVGDKNVTMIERVIIDVPGNKVVRLQMPPDQHRSTLCDDVSCGPDGGWDDVKWAPDGKTLAFVSTSRDHKQEWFRIADAATGKVRTVFEETVPTYLLRKRHGQGQLGVLASHARGGVVLRAQRLGPALPVRPGHRQTQARHHHGRRQCHRDAQGRPSHAYHLVPRSGPHAGRQSVLRTVMESQPRRRAANPADTGSGRPHGRPVAG